MDKEQALESATKLSKGILSEACALMREGKEAMLYALGRIAMTDNQFDRMQIALMRDRLCTPDELTNWIEKFSRLDSEQGKLKATALMDAGIEAIKETAQKLEKELGVEGTEIAAVLGKCNCKNCKSNRAKATKIPFDSDDEESSASYELEQLDPDMLN